MDPYERSLLHPASGKSRVIGGIAGLGTFALCVYYGVKTNHPVIGVVGGIFASSMVYGIVYTGSIVAMGYNPVQTGT